jgi:C-terminal processing protease CtpA/Prc
MRRLLPAAGSALVLALCAAGAAGAKAAAPAAFPPAAAAALKPLDAAERRAVVEQLAGELEDAFVFPEVGARYAAMLRANLAAGAYDGLSDPDKFGEKVTADLQAVARDGHLRLARQAAFEQRRPAPTDWPASTRATGPDGMEEAKMIGDVAYLRFNQFTRDAQTRKAARDFLLAHADARAVILDARPLRGGGMDVMNAILPLLYGQKTALVRMDTRTSVDGDEPVRPEDNLVLVASTATLVSRDHVITPDPTETRLQRVPVYYLTSRRTASAAEHLALAFKRTRRATLVGETTRGAGHFGGLEPIGDRFAAFIPVGRTYDPDTNWDWEGKGVAPDVAVPTDEALARALELARAAGAHPQ